MSILTDITDSINSAPVHIGYAPTGSKLPYIVHRPLLVDPLELAINGDSVDWDYQTSLYCCAGSVEASFNLALAVVNELQGARVGGTTISASIGYSGAPIEGDYESQVTVQLNQGVV